MKIKLPYGTKGSSVEVPEKNLKEMIATLSAIESNLEPWAECMRYEYLMRIKSLPELSSKSRVLTRYGGLRRFSCWELAAYISDSRETERNLERAYSHLVYCAEHPEDRSAALYTETWEGKKGGYGIFMYSDPFGYLVISSSRDYGAFSTADRANDSHLAHLFDLRGTRAFLGVEFFKKKKGKLPTRLGDLVPEYLDAVLVDPFDGKPFRYVADRGIVYSVGTDWIDSGGSERLPPDTTPDDDAPDRWDAEDAVFYIHGDPKPTGNNRPAGPNTTNGDHESKDVHP